MSCCPACAQNLPCEGGAIYPVPRNPLPRHPALGLVPANILATPGGGYAFPTTPYISEMQSRGRFPFLHPTGLQSVIGRELQVPHSAFGAVGPNFRRNVHMAAEAFGVAVAAPMVWWGANQIQDSRARRALKALAVGMAAVDGLLLASYTYDLYKPKSSY